MALLLAFGPAGCSRVPPVAKIGLIAPFEGLYRQTGYAALTALRSALVECAPPGLAKSDVALIPLALDDSADPPRARRAVQKLLADPAVVAIVGPLDLAAAAAVEDLVADRAIPWVVPALVDPAGGYPSRPTLDGMDALLETVQMASKPSPRRIWVAGLPPGFVPNDLPTPSEHVPVLMLDDPAAAPAAVEPGDAVLWLGQPAAGAEFLAALAPRDQVDFWLGPQGGDPVFAAQAISATLPAHWVVWSDPAYNAWSQAVAGATPASYLVYRATCAVLADMAAQDDKDPTPQTPWMVQAYRVRPDGVSEPLASR